MKAQISVIIPVYNVETCLRDTLDCLKRQTYTDYELLLIDDGSKDSSGKICDEYAKEDARIRVFHNENQGPAKTRNYGIEKAEGTYIAFIDSDDLITDDYLEQLLRGYECQEENDLTLCGYERFNTEDGVTTSVHLIGEQELQLFESNRELARLFTTPRTSLNGVSIWAKLYRRSIMTEHNVRFPEKVDYEEDCCFNVQYYRYVRKATVVNKSLYRYRQGTASLSKVYKESTFKNLVNGYNERAKFIKEFSNPKTMMDGVNVVFLVVIMANFKKIANSKMSFRQKRNAYKNMLSFQETKDIMNNCALSKVNLTRKITLACRENNVRKVHYIMWCWHMKETMKTRKLGI